MDDDANHDRKILRFTITNSQITCNCPNVLTKMDDAAISYLLKKFEEDEDFYFYLDSKVYRCASERSEILCMEISDLIDRIARCEDEMKREKGAAKNFMAFMDILIHNIKNYLFLLEGFLNTEGMGENENINKIINDMKNVLRKAYVFLITPDRIVKNKIRVNDMIDDIFRSLWQKAMEKKLTLIKRCRNVVFYGDKIIKEALFNLVDNAIKYTHEGGEVIVECSKDGDTVIIRVKDQGNGIPPELRGMLFERFKRGKDSVGMGLGLAITKHIVDMHNGEIWVEDNKPKGTIFCIRLPRE